MKVSEVFHITFVLIDFLVFLISSLFLHFILTKFKPTVLFDNKKRKNYKEYVKHAKWSCNYKQISRSIMVGSVKVIGSRALHKK